MINNNKQYKITQLQANKFEIALEKLNNSSREGIHPLLWQVQKDGLQSQLDKLNNELKEYEDKHSN